WAGSKIDKVAGIEARGFILGGAVAHQVSAGFVPIRKKGKLPHTTVRIAYSLEYGVDEMEMHEDAVGKGERVILVDDLIATGGTAVGDIGESAIALMARHSRNPNFNRVAGLRGDQVGEIEPLVRWYTDNGVNPRFEILPRDGDSALSRELARLGLYPSSFHTAL